MTHMTDEQLGAAVRTIAGAIAAELEQLLAAVPPDPNSHAPTGGDEAEQAALESSPGDPAPVAAGDEAHLEQGPSPEQGGGPTLDQAAAPDGRPAASDAPRSARVSGRDQVLDAYRRAPSGAWLGRSAIADLAGVHEMTVTKLVKGLHEEGLLEHNGKGGRSSRYRIAPAASEDPAPSEDLVDDDAPQGAAPEIESVTRAKNAKTRREAARAELDRHARLPIPPSGLGEEEDARLQRIAREVLHFLENGPRTLADMGRVLIRNHHELLGICNALVEHQVLELGEDRRYATVAEAVAA